MPAGHSGLARAAHPIDAPLVRRALAALPILAACAVAGGAGCRRADDRRAASSTAASSGFDREAWAPRAGDAGAGEPAVPTTADPAALAEILAASPRGAARPSTGPDGGTAIGADSGVPGDANPPAIAVEAEGQPVLRVGKPVPEPNISAPAIEVAARAQLYWGLTHRCRDPQGKLLPPEAVRVFFRVDTDGFLLPASIVATPRRDEFAPAARCMARELSTTSFRAPPGARGAPHNLWADVPTAD
jgi:hypothetical protein